MLRGGGPAQPPLRRMRAALGRARGAAPRAAPPSSAGAAPLREALPLVLAQAASTWQSAPARRPSSAAPPLAVSTTPPLGERARAPRPTAAAGHARLRQAQKSGSCRGRARRRGRSRSTRAGARLARPTAPARAARRRVSARQAAEKPPMARWAEVRSETSSLGWPGHVVQKVSFSSRDRLAQVRECPFFRAALRAHPVGSPAPRRRAVGAPSAGLDHSSTDRGRT